jgi:alpha-N-arabinofuranosidase
MVLTPAYYVFKMYRVHQDATMLPVKSDCESYTFDSRSIPGISVSASRNAAGLVHVTRTNLNPEKAIQLTCELNGMVRSSVKRGEIISADKMNTCNDFGKPEHVSINAFKTVKTEKNILAVDLPAKSIIMLEPE